jgi:hypothetical protein
MDILLSEYKQEKGDNKNVSSAFANLELWRNDDYLTYIGSFDTDYFKQGDKKRIKFVHTLMINLTNGDISVSYEIINQNFTELRYFRNTKKSKKNDFKMLFDLTENGFVRGEKRISYWGVKYHRATDQILRLILETLKPKFKSQYLYDKISNEKSIINSLYDMLVDFHLDVKGIKGHDSVYHDIQNEYPKKKWLAKNENKFLPAVLDSYGIKSKYLVSELNKSWSKPIQISALNYICKLFGANHVQYLKRFLWETHCYEMPPNKKIHELKNDSEKNCMVDTINKWERETLKSDSLVYLVNKLLTIRELLEKRGVDNLKYKAKNDNEFDNILEFWSGIKMHFARGYKVKYVFPDGFIEDAERDIEVDGLVFKLKVLETEEDFRMEGYKMKNCMAKQFTHGVLYIYVTLYSGKKRINLQYRKGKLVQAYGKANTPVKDEYQNAISELSRRLSSYDLMEWKKDKYDFLTN